MNDDIVFTIVPMLDRTQHLTKRLFDIVLSLLVLPFLAVPLLLLTILAAMSTRQQGIFTQLRVGQHGKLFRLYKIRTLKGRDHAGIQEIIENETAFGSWLRSSKLDELPQVLNILVGDMSWVGPRPDVAGYADRLEGDDRIILSVKPGLTGPATLKYRNEDKLLLRQQNPERYNDTVIWPDKVRINKSYIENWSLAGDIRFLWYSLFSGYSQ